MAISLSERLFHTTAKKAVHIESATMMNTNFEADLSQGIELKLILKLNKVAE